MRKRSPEAAAAGAAWASLGLGGGAAPAAAGPLLGSRLRSEHLWAAWVLRAPSSCGASVQQAEWSAQCLHTPGRKNHGPAFPDVCRRQRAPLYP